MQTDKLIERLRDYRYICSKIREKQERIYEVRACLQASSTSSVSATPNHGGGNKYESKLIAMLDNLWGLERELSALVQDKRTIDNAIATHLTDIEQDAINLFYINRPRDNSHVRKLERKYNYGQAQIYRAKNSALAKLCKAIDNLQ